MEPAGGNPSSLIDSASEDELIVAQILLDLRGMFDIVESVPGPKWKRKRKRSCLSDGAPPSPAPLRERMPQKEEELAAASASPDTPLNFPCSESYEKLGRSSSRKNVRKKSAREYIALMEELTQRGDLLRKEIDKVTEYHNKLKTQNSQLKAMKQELLNSCPMRKKAQQIAEAPTPHSQPLVSDRTAEECQYSLGLGAAPQSNGPSAAHGVGPFVTPDLNASCLEASEPLDGRQVDNRRVRFAEARRRRREIIRSKLTGPGTKS